MATTAARSKGEHKQRELKEKAVAFYTQHNVPATLEKLLNEMFVAAPQDVYGYMSEYFDKLSQEPVICRATCCEALDERGGKAVEVHIYCTVHGVEKYVTSISIPLLTHPPPPPPTITATPTKPGKKKESEPSIAETEQQNGEKDRDVRDVVDAFKSFNTYIAPELVSHPPNKQAQIDDRIVALRDEGGRQLHPSSLLATSLAIAKSAALLTSTPLHQHLTSSLLPPPQPPKLSLPFPITALLAEGSGKLKIREFCLTPQPGIGAFTEQMSVLTSVYREMGALLAAKSGPSGAAVALPSGAYCPPTDRPEAALDLVREAAQSAGMALDKDVGIIIDVGADKMFDQGKGKYELATGQWKTNHEMIALYSDLLTSYPGLLGYIDPLHHKDLEGWKKLQETLGNKCLLVANKTLEVLQLSTKTGDGDAETEQGEREGERTEEEGEMEGEEEGGLSYLSCAGLSLESTLSETCSRASCLRGCAHYIMLSAPPTLTVNPLLADLAVALQCRFIRLAAPVGLTSTCLLSRMLQIREELSSSGTYDPAQAHVFSSTPVRLGEKE